MGMLSLIGDLLSLSGAPNSPSLGGTAVGSAGPVFGGGGPGGPPLSDEELGMPSGDADEGFGSGGGGPGGDSPTGPDEQDECE